VTKEPKCLDALAIILVLSLAGATRGAHSWSCPSRATAGRENVVRTESSNFKIQIGHVPLTIFGLGGGRSRRGGGRRTRVAWSGCAWAECGTNIADFDVRVGDGGIGALSFKVFGLSGVSGAGTTSSTEAGRVDGVGRIEPEHVCIMIVPDREGKDHAVLVNTSGHTVDSTLVLEAIAVAKGALLRGAEFFGDRIIRIHPGNVHFGVLDDLAVLYVDATDLLEFAVGSAIRGDELGNDGKFLLCVDGHARSVERLVTHAVGVEVAAIWVADSAVAVVGGVALGVGASVLPRHGAWMGSVGGSDGVGFPDIHLVTAGAIFSISTVGIAIGGVPAFNVGLRADE